MMNLLKRLFGVKTSKPKVKYVCGKVTIAVKSKNKD